VDSTLYSCPLVVFDSIGFPSLLLKYFFGVNLYYSNHIFDSFYFIYIPKMSLLITPYIFHDTQKYSLCFECLAGQENCLIDTLIKRTFLVIPTASDLEDSLNRKHSWSSLLPLIWITH
jgi:hypothetical protein